MCVAELKAFSAYTGNMMNARQADANADQVRDAGFANELSFRDQARHDIADQQAKMANSGVSLASGSPLLVLAESTRNKALDALAIRDNALRNAQTYRNQASAYRFAAPLSAAGELLSGAAQAASGGAMGGLGG